MVLFKLLIDLIWIIIIYDIIFSEAIKHNLFLLFYLFFFIYQAHLYLFSHLLLEKLSLMKIIYFKKVLPTFQGSIWYRFFPNDLLSVLNNLTIAYNIRGFILKCVNSDHAQQTLWWVFLWFILLLLLNYWRKLIVHNFDLLLLIFSLNNT